MSVRSSTVVAGLSLACVMGSLTACTGASSTTPSSTSAATTPVATSQMTSATTTAAVPTQAPASTAVAPASATPSSAEPTVHEVTIGADPSASEVPVPANDYEEWRSIVLAEGGSTVTGDGCTLTVPSAFTVGSPGTRCDPALTLTLPNGTTVPVTVRTVAATGGTACALAKAGGRSATEVHGPHGVVGCRATTQPGKPGWVATWYDDPKGGAVRSVEATLPLARAGQIDPEVQDLWGQIETALTYEVSHGTGPGQWSGTLPPGKVTKG